MAQEPLHRSFGSGVCFPTGSHAGIVRRILSMLVDFAVVFALLPTISYAVYYSTDNEPSASVLLFWSISSWLYLTKIKASNVRTLGYRAAGIKIVDCHGDSPSILTMTMRLGLSCLGPFNPITDLLWIGADPNGRSLRDCYTRTHVVRKNATPAGTAPLFMVYYTALGCTLAYPSATQPKDVEEATTAA